MTSFQPLPDGPNFRMDTLITHEDAHTLTVIRDLESRSITEGVRRVVGIHHLYTTAHAAGGLLIAQTDRLDVLSPPLAEISTADQLERIPMQINVNPEVKEHIESCVEDLDDLVTTLAFWRSAIGFYNDIHERQVLGARFYRMGANLSMSQISFNDPFDPPEPRRRRRWRP